MARAAADTCFACGQRGLRTFYEVRGIPVHSCLMLADRREALDYPKGDLRLGHCPSCGLVQNVLFDPSVHEYSTRYEETQHFSPRFLRFCEGLVDKLVADYDLRGKSVLEIGCGKGEFLVMLAERGECRGTGIDPGYRPERTTSPAAGRIQFLQDFYGPKYTHLNGEMVACRHTLEHIQPVREFVELVRESVGDGQDTVVFFEVPDVARVLEEQAFWDVYYEHCSYFSLGSLARLFRQCRFDLVDLWTDFDDQYLMLVAKPGDGRGGKRFAIEDDLARMQRAVDRFAAEVPRKQAQWRDQVRAAKARGERIVVWGSGSKCVAWLTTMGIRDEIEFVVDVNPHKHGMFLAGTGHEIVSPAFLKDYRPDLVVIMNPIYRDEIRADCERLGLRPELMAV